MVSFARSNAVESISLAQDLVKALKSGDKNASIAAYTALRPNYEEIEHLYEVFGHTDSDIDARPYAYPYGEAFNAQLTEIPGAIFKGSHKIETMLFREDDLQGAIPWTEQLIKDYETLIEKLDDPSDYTPEAIMHGVAELAYEVAKKKFSSEEETYSDLSILIFYHNLAGIKNIMEPWFGALEESNPVSAEGLAKSIDTANTLLAPYVIRDGDGNIVRYEPYSSVNITTRRNIQKSFYDVGLAVEDAADSLGIELVDPSESGEAGEGEAESSDECTPLTKTRSFSNESPQIQNGLAYFSALMPYAVQESEAFIKVLKNGDVDEAKSAYLSTRPIYEQVKVLAPSFIDIDEALDAREYIYFRGELDDSFRGFHRVERLLFGENAISNETVFLAEDIVNNLKDLQGRLQNPSEDFNGANAWDGIAGLASEVPSKKISSEEETFSDFSLMIFYNNWKGIWSQIYPFCSDATAECEEVAKAILDARDCLDIDTDDDITAVSAANVTKDSVSYLLKANYKSYANATMATRKCIIDKGYGVRDAVVIMGNALNVFDDCSDFYDLKFINFPERSTKLDVSEYEGDSSAESKAGEVGADGTYQQDETSSSRGLLIFPSLTILVMTMKTFIF